MRGREARDHRLAERAGRGKPAINYRLRDWSFSRQRYWGCPIPIIYCEDHGLVPVPEDQLPVLLPEVEDYRPKGQPPLASNRSSSTCTCPVCGRPGKREADTMDTFVDSSWYFLRYTDPRNEQAPFDRSIADYWMPIDQYIGGIDHAKGHLLYSRFFVKALNDLGLVGFREPFQRLFHQGWVQLGGTKMSKSQGGVSPNELIERFGADAIRLYILFFGPADQDIDWTPDGHRRRWRASSGACGVWCTRSPSGPRRRRRDDAARAEGARRRSRASPTTSTAVRRSTHRSPP